MNSIFKRKIHTSWNHMNCFAHDWIPDFLFSFTFLNNFYFFPYSLGFISQYFMLYFPFLSSTPPFFFFFKLFLWCNKIYTGLTCKQHINYYFDGSHVNFSCLKLFSLPTCVWTWPPHLPSDNPQPQILFSLPSLLYSSSRNLQFEYIHFFSVHEAKASWLSCLIFLV